MVVLSRTQLLQLLKSSLENHIFPSHYFWQRVVHYMVIVLQKHFFIKWDKRKVPGFKESYCNSSILSCFAYGKTRLRCRQLALNNKYTKKYTYLEVFSVANVLLLMLIRDSCVIQTNFSYITKFVELLPKNADTFLSKLGTRNTYSGDLRKKWLTYCFLFQKNIDFNQSGCTECR